MTRLRVGRELVLLGALGALGCGAAGPSDEPGDPADAAPVYRATWHRDVQPIVARHCQVCHAEGGIAPFALTAYDEAALLAPRLLQEVEAGVMPPWAAVSDDDCAPRLPWRDDPRLDDDELELLRAWVEDGAPAGDPDDAPDPEPVPDPHLTGITETLVPATPFVTSGASDQLVCFAIGVPSDHPRWLTGVEFTPQNLAVVHHALLYLVPPEGVATLEALAGPEGRYDCFSDIAPGAALAGVWVPGSTPISLPSGTGFPVPAGSRYALQVHYHPAGETNDPDATRVDLRMTDTAPAWNMSYVGAGNATAAPQLLPGPNDRDVVEFRVPAGVGDHTETMEIALDVPGTLDVPLISVFPHMHYLGVDFELTIERATPERGQVASECLVKSAWNFDWQQTYHYDAIGDALPTLGDGDLIRLTCRYDNTLENAFVTRALAEQDLWAPIDVGFGLETLDEMCGISFGVLTPASP
jgi:hypothetical protein